MKERTEKRKIDALIRSIENTSFEKLKTLLENQENIDAIRSHAKYALIAAQDNYDSIKTTNFLISFGILENLNIADISDIIEMADSKGYIKLVILYVEKGINLSKEMLELPVEAGCVTATLKQGLLADQLFESNFDDFLNVTKELTESGKEILKGLKHEYKWYLGEETKSVNSVKPEEFEDSHWRDVFKNRFNNIFKQKIQAMQDISLRPDFIKLVINNLTKAGLLKNSPEQSQSIEQAILNDIEGFSIDKIWEFSKETLPVSNTNNSISNNNYNNTNNNNVRELSNLPNKYPDVIVDNPKYKNDYSCKYWTEPIKTQANLRFDQHLNCHARKLHNSVNKIIHRDSNNLNPGSAVNNLQQFLKNKDPEFVKAFINTPDNNGLTALDKILATRKFIALKNVIVNLGGISTEQMQESNAEKKVDCEDTTVEKKATENCESKSPISQENNDQVNHINNKHDYNNIEWMNDFMNQFNQESKATDSNELLGSEPPSAMHN